MYRGDVDIAVDRGIVLQLVVDGDRACRDFQNSIFDVDLARRMDRELQGGHRDRIGFQRDLQDMTSVSFHGRRFQNERIVRPAGQHAIDRVGRFQREAAIADCHIAGPHPLDAIRPPIRVLTDPQTAQLDRIARDLPDFGRIGCFLAAPEAGGAGWAYNQTTGEMVVNEAAYLVW